MRLTAFRVTNFRSVADSAWIEASSITSLIGTNESGKTNLLVPLWKLNPAKEGEIKLLADAPRKEYATIRQAKEKPIFIRARFELEPSLSAQIAEIAGVDLMEVQEVEVARDFSGNRYIQFPKANPTPTIDRSDILGRLQTTRAEIDGLKPADEADRVRKPILIGALDKALALALKQPAALNALEVRALTAPLETVSQKDAQPTSASCARLSQAIAEVFKLAEDLGKPGANDCAAAKKLILDSLPAFVYYTTYGNLDSEIYLPHVIENLKRADLPSKEEAKARTLRVLFDFVRLKPEEILDLGKEVPETGAKPKEAQIQEAHEKKKERSVLLQAASSELTARFREFWKQGEYRLRFEADGNHFRIWVSDDKRPEEIELEGRSTGLQWFLSFYLIFLVESKAAHNGAILLLDEPGHSLHPLAQQDLSAFFESLSNSNQLLYTTHSPFLVDPNNLDRVRAIFVNLSGQTCVSTDLRAGQAAARSKSIYPVHAALGLSVSDILFQGCRSIIVEGQSDQYYLSAIKNLLVGSGRVRSYHEILFVPSAGAKGIKTTAAILGGRNENLPIVLCDGDLAGKTLAKNLKDTDYSRETEKVLLVSDFVTIPDAESEDLFPKDLLVPLIDRLLHCAVDDPFIVSDPAAAIVPQVRAFAAKRGIALMEGWKVELARLVKAQLSSLEAGDGKLRTVLPVWQSLFTKLAGSETGASVPATATKA